MTIEKNQLRERAKKLPEITPEMWEQVHPLYKRVMADYLSSIELSKQTKKQYISALRQFGWFVTNSLNNKPIYKLKKKDGMRYINYLREDRKMSSSGINMKKSAVSAMCQYIENYLADDDDYEDDKGDLMFETFRNFMQGLPPVVKTQTYDKKKVTKDEYDLMMKALEEDENYLGMAWLAVAFNVGARRSEIIQFKTSILSEDWNESKKYKKHSPIRGKGRGEEGKRLEYLFYPEALKYIQLWTEKRGYDHEFIFTIGQGENIRVMGRNWADYFCENTLSHILGRRINPHIFKASCITYLLEHGIKMEVVSKHFAHHNSTATTEIYNLSDSTKELDNLDIKL